MDIKTLDRKELYNYLLDSKIFVKNAKNIDQLLDLFNYLGLDASYYINRDTCFMYINFKGCYTGNSDITYFSKYNSKELDVEELLHCRLSDFKPFDKVLMRNDESDEWACQFFSAYEDTGEYLAIGGFSWGQCIPYEGNEHLVKTCKHY